MYQDGVTYNLGKICNLIILMSDAFYSYSEWRDKNKVLFEEKAHLKLKYSDFNNQFPICGYFPLFDRYRFRFFVGVKGSKGYVYDRHFNETQVESNLMPRQFNLDSTIVRVGNFIWLFGGSAPCGKK